jgi:SAM-dependent methyltransferase
MNPRLLTLLQCPACRNGHLEQSSDAALRCVRCAAAFAVVHGAPRFVREPSDTEAFFGYIWGLQAPMVTPPRTVLPYHLRKMRDTLEAPPFAGLVLDAGCGDGTDLAFLALDPACEVVGVELSAGGVATSLGRTTGLDRAHVVQGDLLNLPLANEQFDGAYSYGVVHHTPDPPRAVREIARTLKPGASLLFYVYEDFSDRSWYWRLALWTANLFRVITTRLPPAVLMRLCRMLSPVVWLLCTVPSRHFTWAARFPYRHNTSPWSLRGDLYDRLSAPIEERYSREGAARLATTAGLEVVRTAQERGWMVWARAPEAPADVR